jgi:hypothetical protein
MTFFATKVRVFNRGIPSDEFLTELINFGKKAPDEYFAANANFDIYNKVGDELGPFDDLLKRKAVLLEVERVLGMFESSGNWNEGVDSSRQSSTTNENAEAGAWQVSWNNRKLDPSLSAFLSDKGINDGVTFQQKMKSDHMLAMSFISLLLRIDVKDFNRINNGPVRKGIERKTTWPNRPKLWDAAESIYPWLSRAAVTEFESFL